MAYWRTAYHVVLYDEDGHLMDVDKLRESLDSGTYPDEVLVVTDSAVPVHEIEDLTDSPYIRPDDYDSGDVVHEDQTHLGCETVAEYQALIGQLEQLADGYNEGRFI